MSEIWAVTCHSTLRCSSCGGPHAYKDCDATTNFCCLCDGNHSAAFKGCPKYKEAQDIQKFKVNNNVSYATAVKAIKTNTEPLSTHQTLTSGPRDPSVTNKQQIQSSSSLLSAPISRISSVVHDIVDNTQLGGKKLFSQITAFVLKVVAIAQDSSFWKQERNSRIQHITDVANSIFCMDISTKSVQEQYSLTLNGS